MEDKQNRFFDYFRGQMNKISEIGDDSFKTHKKLLYVSFIDTLSGLVYPTLSDKNRDRFVSIVTNCSDWKEGQNISLFHLKRALSLNPNHDFNALRAFVDSKLSEWEPGNCIEISQDVSAGVIGTHWPKGKDLKESYDGVSIESLKHVSLLYRYRNSLVHSFRPLGSDI